MKTEVLMPQMGESVAEGTVTEWLKQIGDFIERDEPLFEITTDKVDADVPSPKEGVLVEKRVSPGETVAVDSIVAVIDTEAKEGQIPEDSTAEADSVESNESDTASSSPDADADTSEPVADESTETEPATARGDGDPFPSKAELRRTRSTPLVRRIAREHGIDDLSPIPGSGLSGRVTKEDIQDYIDKGKHKQPSRAEPSVQRPDLDIEAPDVQIGPNDTAEPLSEHRKRIAEHMTMSRAVSPHAHTVHEVDFSRVAEAYENKKREFADRDVNLTYTAFIVQAAVASLREFPMVNSAMGDEQIIYRGDINIGVAVALDKSLIVPVIENADDLSLLGTARHLQDLATRARNKNLDPSEVEGGTFTISNHGIYGPEFGIPIINQPQAAILSIGAIKKRLAVNQQTDAIEIRPTAFWCLSFDHRIVDGATADKFMQDMRSRIEKW